MFNLEESEAIEKAKETIRYKLIENNKLLEKAYNALVSVIRRCRKGMNDN